ncbi:hypothetical protein SAMN05428966_102374 [Massilia sp. PDC64]|nr:hypothetical protein [Massilia sp. PDC64]SDC80473.1 hypothetical protein SAMN05428966_102374 [Massilia sp. PDC64]
MKALLQASTAAALIAVLNIGHAAPDPRYCQMMSTLAKKIAEDRDKGVSYKAELGLLKGATEDGTASMTAIYKAARGMAKVIYIDNPNLTPEGAYKLHYVICMSAK